MRPSRPAVAAAIVLGLQGLAILIISLLELIALIGGGAASGPTGVALIVLTLLTAAALFVFAVGTLRRRSWARSGGVVFQVLGIALGLAALGLDPKPWTFILGVGGSALLCLILLLSATRRDGAHDPRLRRSAE